MEQKFKFSIGDNAFFLKSVNEFIKVTISKIEFFKDSKSHSISYQSETGDSYTESDLLTKREFTEYVSNL